MKDLNPILLFFTRLAFHFEVILFACMKLCYIFNKFNRMCKICSPQLWITLGKKTVKWTSKMG